MSSTLLRALGDDADTAARRTHECYSAEVRALARGIPGLARSPLDVQVYHCLPWLFADAIPVEPGTLATVGAAGLLYFGYVLAVDRALDGDATPDGADMLWAGLMHERALTMLAPLLPADTPAWDAIAALARQYAAAVLDERALVTAGYGSADDERLRRIAVGKAALLKATPAVMACVARRPELLGRFDEAIDQFSDAVQMRDDLQDWRADLAAGRPSRVLRRATAALPADASPEAVGHALFHGGIADEALHDAVARCEAALRAAAEGGAARWARFVAGFQMQLLGAAEGFARERARAAGTGANFGRAQLDAALGRAVSALEAAHRDGLHEGTHRMRFPHAMGFGGEREEHEGDVFQRAVFGWSLGEIRASGVPVPTALLEENFAALRARRVSDGGGWSYFPTLPDLAPDADDLAQVLLAALALPDARHRAACERPVERVLSRHLRADGLVDTWIDDLEASPAIRDRRRAAAAMHWGRERDPEVAANLFHALHHWDVAERDARPPRWEQQVAAACRALAACQRADGAWESPWYVGPDYGTWVCARLIAETFAEEGTAALARAAEFLARTQRPDGSWSQAGSVGDPLATAFGLMAWRACHGGQGPGSTGERAVRYLWLTQRDDGRWPRADWIRMNVACAVRGAPARYLTHGSATATTAYAAAALAQARQGAADG
jgi:squalene-hopene/tetraprenyl-beta-curcumene cyclase